MQHIKPCSLLFRLGFLSLLTATLSCTEGTDGELGADSAIAACECSALSASEIAYDNMETGLESTTVQEAISEVAQVAQVDFAERIFTVDNEIAAPIASSIASTSAQCGGGQDTAQALGGGCDIDNSNAILITAELRDSSYRCVWDKPAGQAATGVARVSCLSLIP
tara:strand:- start:1279 stop:1776 length:498 start_codon:yes stop_codon:yes gene_type:complete